MTTIHRVSTSAEPQLTLNEANALVGVRSLMAEASRRGADRSVAGRHVAVVLLDSAVEAALAVCLGRFGDSANERDTLADLHKRLSGTTKTAFPGWREVGRLRRARNLAHHHQIPVDPEALAGFFGPVAEYLDAAVRSTFGIRITDVALADSIVDPSARARVAEAEDAIAEGDVAKGVSALSLAFGEALRRSTGLTTGSGTPHFDDLGFGQAIESAVKPIRDATTGHRFSADKVTVLQL